MAENNQQAEQNSIFNFFSFNPLSRRARSPLPPIEKAASPLYYPGMNPNIIPTDHAAVIGGSLAGGTIAHLETAVRAMAGGRGETTNYGSRERILDMNRTYLEEASKAIPGGQRFLEQLGIEFDLGTGTIKKDAFEATYETIRNKYQDERNRAAFFKHWDDSEGKVVSGYGKFHRRGVTGLVDSLETILKTGSATRAEALAEKLSNSSSRFRDVGFGAKGREYSYVANRFIPALVDGQSTVQFWKDQKDEYVKELENNTKVEYRTSIIGKFQQELNKSYSEKGNLLKGFDQAQRIHKKYSKFSKERNKFANNPYSYTVAAPFRIFWHLWLKKRFYQSLLKLINKFFPKLLNSRLVGELKILFRGGPSRLSTNAAKRGGEIIGKYGKQVLSSAAKSVASFIKKNIPKLLEAAWSILVVVVDVIGTALAAAASAAGTVVGAIAGSTVGLIVGIIAAAILLVIVLFAGSIFILHQNVTTVYGCNGTSCQPPPSIGGNQQLVQAMLALDPRNYSPSCIGGNLPNCQTDFYCLRMVSDALIKSGSKKSLTNIFDAAEVFNLAQGRGFQTIFPNQIPATSFFQPGDIVDWSGGGGDYGHIGVVVSVASHYIYVASNLDAIHYPVRVTPYVFNPTTHMLNVAGGYGVQSPTYPFLGILR